MKVAGGLTAKKVSGEALKVVLDDVVRWWGSAGGGGEEADAFTDEGIFRRDGLQLHHTNHDLKRRDNEDDDVRWGGRIP